MSTNRNIQFLKGYIPCKSIDNMKILDLVVGDIVHIANNYTFYVIEDKTSVEAIPLPNSLFAKPIPNPIAPTSPDSYTVDTIEKLKELRFLKEGNVVEVLGYYQAGDGAGHKRKIENEDDGSGVQLANGLWANICEREISLKMLGCRKNDEVDVKFNSLINNDNQMTIIVDDYYIVANNIKFKNNKRVIFTPNAVLKAKPQIKEKRAMLQMNLSNNIYIENPVLIGEALDKPLEQSTEWEHGIDIGTSKNIKIINPKISHFYGDGIYVGSTYWNNDRESEHIRIYNPYIYDCGRNGISICGCIDTKIYNPYIEKIDKWAPKSCIDIETEHYTLNDLRVDVEIISPYLKNDNNTCLLIISRHNYNSNKIVFKNSIFENGENNITTSNGSYNIYFDNLKLINPRASCLGLKINKSSYLYIDNFSIINPCTQYQSETNTPVGIYDTVFLIDNDVNEFGNVIIDKLNCYIENPKQNPALIYERTNSESFGTGNGCITINAFKTNKLMNIYRNNNSIQIIKINDYLITDIKNREKVYSNKYILNKYENFRMHHIFTDDLSERYLVVIQDDWVKDLVNSITNMSSKNVTLRPDSEKPAAFAEGNQTIKPNGFIKFVYSSIDNKVHILDKYEAPTVETTLDTPIYKNLMEQERVWNDYVNYRVAQLQYDKEQKAREKAKQQAYELLLKENPNLTWEEFEQQYGNNVMMNLSLVERLEEPVIPESVVKFMEKYLGTTPTPKVETKPKTFSFDEVDKLNDTLKKL